MISKSIFKIFYYSIVIFLKERTKPVKIELRKLYRKNLSLVERSQVVLFYHQCSLFILQNSINFYISLKYWKIFCTDKNNLQIFCSDRSDQQIKV